MQTTVERKSYIRKRIVALVLGMMLVILCCMDVYASAVPRKKTPDYKVAFYESDCYHMQDVNGKRYGYGYDMMQYISNYTQGTFSYVGYEKTAKECEEMLQNGEIDLYTAARRTPEREKDYVFSSHPAITAVTCMNIKRGKENIILLNQIYSFPKINHMVIDACNNITRVKFHFMRGWIVCFIIMFIIQMISNNHLR